MHGLQVQDATGHQALQAVCQLEKFTVEAAHLTILFCSFELGGEKKTKGAALQFVRVFASFLLPYLSLTPPSPQ